MTDPCVTKLAKVLVNYSVEIKPGQQVHISSSHLASELTLAVYEEAIKAGANVFLEKPLDEAGEILYKYASDVQLDYVSPLK
jgi:aminopeptidase